MPLFLAAAKSFTTAATLFASPGKKINSTSPTNSSSPFHFVLDGDIQTLSAQNAPEDGPIKGLLFVPSLSSHDPCDNATAPFIPANVTRHHDVTPFTNQTTGIAPWITPNCSQSFLEASRRVGAEALVFFLPESDDTKPPPPADTTWLLSGSSSWESENMYPVYAIPGPAGLVLMEQLSWFSNNRTLPQDQINRTEALSQNETWNLRLFSVIDLGELSFMDQFARAVTDLGFTEERGGKAPSIWGFLLAILGTIIVLCMILLLLYQLLQRRRREDLQRQLEAGTTDHQYDLQHFRVPRDILARLPVYIYPGPGDPDKEGAGFDSGQNNFQDRIDSVRDAKTDPAKVEKEPEAESEAQITKYTSPIRVLGTLDTEQNLKTNARHEKFPPRPCPYEPSSPTTKDETEYDHSKHAKRLSRSQTTCAICLDDFIPSSSTVRELPCGHIYHPECIDISLTHTSSLCPLCKKSVLAPEFFPISTPGVVDGRDGMTEL
ncbi:uncharacterized protein DSM5745_08126 [Aspergillus mulundensis]|uniref:RING-type domain-containing protein n=1 Tax=Aspergillus mulundensis TaxID=1810919 RepID=A0A3D8R9B0_9EURO|nr:hypothetical protein DSM5745_08126 [Aspergillus mulundensis]RDW70615.1 hypothetical protein DSM5745_08126 [Aspergillus mulundensis]